MNAVLNTFVTKLADVHSIDAGHALMGGTLAKMGFDRFAYLGLHLPDASLAEPVLVHSFDNKWIERYVEKSYATVDPVVERGLASVLPFNWGGDQARKRMGHNSRKMMDEASDFGLSRGLTVPIHGERGELAVFSIALPDKENEANKCVQTYIHDIHLMALYFHAHLGDRIFAEVQSKKNTLTKREQECLLWASQGKTAWETGEILTLSEHTIREYIKSACRKLGVFSKNHAVVKAMMLGMIKPDI